MRANDVDHVHSQTRIKLTAWENYTPPTDMYGNIVPVHTVITVDLMVDDKIVGQAMGDTLGQALMNLGAMMCGKNLVRLKISGDEVTVEP